MQYQDFKSIAQSLSHNKLLVDFIVSKNYLIGKYEKINIEHLSSSPHLDDMGNKSIIALAVENLENFSKINPNLEIDADFFDDAWHFVYFGLVWIAKKKLDYLPKYYVDAMSHAGKSDRKNWKQFAKEAKIVNVAMMDKLFFKYDSERLLDSMFAAVIDYGKNWIDRKIGGISFKKPVEKIALQLLIKIDDDRLNANFDAFDVYEQLIELVENEALDAEVLEFFAQMERVAKLNGWVQYEGGLASWLNNRVGLGLGLGLDDKEIALLLSLVNCARNRFEVYELRDEVEKISQTISRLSYDRTEWYSYLALNDNRDYFIPSLLPKEKEIQEWLDYNG